MTDITDERVQRHAGLWTTDSSRYVIWDGEFRLIFDIEADGPLVVDDEDGVYEAVVARMLAAGVRLVPHDALESVRKRRED